MEDIGLSLSPMVYFAQFNLNADAVAMVTASHNENGWTGVKMGIKKGLTHAPEEMAELKKITLDQKFINGNGNEKEIKDFQEIYKKKCISQSGKSVYEIALLAKKDGMGEIRLEFNDEVNLYSAKVLIINANNIVGVAKFKSSLTGQTEGSPWVFTYYFNTDKLIEDGRLEANCSEI